MEVDPIDQLASIENGTAAVALDDKNQANATQFDDFTCFPELPFEIRVKIWRLSILPRIVTIDVHLRGYIEYNVKHAIPDTLDEDIFEIDNTDPIPAILHVCHEAREEALKVYKLCFGTHLERKCTTRTILFTSEPRTYFSYSLDTVHINLVKPDTWTRTFYEWHAVSNWTMTEYDKQNIRSMSTNCWSKYYTEDETWVTALVNFKSLEWIILPMDMYDTPQSEDVEIRSPDEGRSEPVCSVGQRSKLSKSCQFMDKIIDDAERMLGRRRWETFRIPSMRFMTQERFKSKKIASRRGIHRDEDEETLLE